MSHRPSEPDERSASHPSWNTGAIAAACAVVVFALAHASALREPFFSDDYIFMERVRGASLAALLSPAHLPFSWYRPWARELHYAALLRAFGPHPLAFHLASAALWVGVIVLYTTYVARLAGRAAALVAAAAVMALAPWTLLLGWAPGAQDLWMMLLSLASLHAFASRRAVPASLALAGALLSKETAAVVPALALAHALLVDRHRVRDAFVRVLPLAIVTAVWAAWHPLLGGRAWWPQDFAPLAAGARAGEPALARLLLLPANLDLLPRPEGGWAHVLAHAAPVALVLAALAAGAAWRGGERTSRAEGVARLAGLGAAWAVLGWLPRLAPSLAWQPYYGLFGALGVWLAVAALLAPRPWLAAPLVLIVALLGAARVATPSREWGSEWLQQQGRAFMVYTEGYLRGRYPTLPRHARLYFSDVPRGTVFITGPGDSPALRAWYGDPTVQGSFWSSYRARTAGDSLGPDRFFRHDSLAGWIEIVAGREDDAARRANPRWREDQDQLAYLLAGSGDPRAALPVYEKLAAAFPDSAIYCENAAVCCEALGDSLGALRWFARADARTAHVLTGR